MKALANINLPKLTLGASPEPAAEDERVLELFRNRAELKKAYSELQDEIHQLRDRLKQQEGVTARVQEMLQELEQRLESPETAFPALVFYALKRLWGVGNRILDKFIDDLRQQATAAESRAFFVECNRRRFERRRELEAALQTARDNVLLAEEKLRELESQRVRLAKPWHYFKRKELEERLSIANAAVQAARGDMEPAQQEFSRFEQEAQEQFPGLSNDARRQINLAAVALAEVLCQRLVRTPLVGLAKAASLKRVSGDDYGTRSECEALIEDIGRAIAIVEQKLPNAADLKGRVERLRALARYRSDSDTVPLPNSLAESAPAEKEIVIDLSPLPRSKAAPKVPAPPNVLADDTWDIFKTLLR